MEKISPIPATMEEYRKVYNARHKEFMGKVTKDNFVGILDVIVRPRLVDMKGSKETYERQGLENSVEYLYKNDGRDFNPTTEYPPHMLDAYGKDYALNARGIYYRDFFLSRLVTVGREVWVPTVKRTNWDDPSEEERRQRARGFARHNLNNESRHKSEYAWEADAWADVFGTMRNDPCLEIDKHEYNTEFLETHPVLCTLTGKSNVKSRIPDATFGLATFAESVDSSPVWVKELSRELLERLLLHPKCGLRADPKWGETDLVFPFAVYEAKGWSGDPRAARRQACEGAACYLDMLDSLARTPGPPDSPRVYQTKKSHQYQVFVLTSYGAHWHLLVGYRRPRQKDEHREREGLSENVYIFQKIWSGRVVNERAAWELLSLIDQIHLWAITEFRSFVLDHLKPWHKFCQDNYLLDWSSAYNVPEERKRLRTYNSHEDLALPSWVKRMSDPFQQRLRERAKISLDKARAEHTDRKGKSRCEDESGWHCLMGECANSHDVTYTTEALLDHDRIVHGNSEKNLAVLKRCLDQAEFYGDNWDGKMERDSNPGAIHPRDRKRHLIEEDGIWEDGCPGSSSGGSGVPAKRLNLG